MAPIMMVDGRSGGDDIGGAGDDVYSENIEYRCVSWRHGIYVTHTVITS